MSDDQRLLSFLYVKRISLRVTVMGFIDNLSEIVIDYYNTIHFTPYLLSFKCRYELNDCYINMKKCLLTSYLLAVSLILCLVLIVFSDLRRDTDAENKEEKFIKKSFRTRCTSASLFTTMFKGLLFYYYYLL